jgi:hypothetical protein
MCIFQVAKGEGFQAVAQQLINIGATYGKVKASDLFVNPTNLSRRYIPEMYAHAKKRLGAELHTLTDEVPEWLPAMALTTDHGRDKYTKTDYTSLMAHYITPDFVLPKRTLWVRKYSGTSMAS